LDVTPSAVSQAVTSGRLSKSLLTKSKGSRRFEVYAAVLEWENGRNLDQVRTTAPVGPILNSDFPTIAESRQAYEYYQALNEQLAALEKAGRLVDLDVAQREVFLAARVMRDRLQEIPEKMRFSVLATGLADEDADSLIKQLSDEIYQTLLLLSEMDISEIREAPLSESIKKVSDSLVGNIDAH
jgi:hypothetical protein